MILDFRRLCSGQVWEQQSQEKHTTEEGKEAGGVSAGRVTGFTVLSIFFHANAKHMHVQPQIHTDKQAPVTTSPATYVFIFLFFASCLDALLSGKETKQKK